MTDKYGTSKLTLHVELFCLKNIYQQMHNTQDHMILKLLNMNRYAHLKVLFFI